MWPCGDGFVFYASFELLLAMIIYVSPLAINNQSRKVIKSGGGGGGATAVLLARGARAARTKLLVSLKFLIHGRGCHIMVNIMSHHIHHRK